LMINPRRAKKRTPIEEAMPAIWPVLRVSDLGVDVWVEVLCVVVVVGLLGLDEEGVAAPPPLPLVTSAMMM